MSGTRFLVDNPAGGPLVADAAPNTTAPIPARVFRFAKAGQTSDGAWFAATGGSPTVQLWMFVPELDPTGAQKGRWVKLGAALALVADETTILGFGVLPYDAPFFVQVTAVGGATRIAIGSTQS